MEINYRTNNTLPVWRSSEVLVVEGLDFEGDPAVWVHTETSCRAFYGLMARRRAVRMAKRAQRALAGENQY